VLLVVAGGTLVLITEPAGSPAMVVALDGGVVKPGRVSDDFDVEAVVFLHQLKFAIVVCQICHELVEFQAAAAERRCWVGARIGYDRDGGPGDSVVAYTG
jgi:hypothetical protein